MSTLIKDLNKLLATTAVFAQKVSNLHWNMQGPLFMQYHKMTDELYNKLQDLVDPLAEKILMQKGKPLVTFKEFLEHSEIKEISGKVFSTEEVVKILVADLNIYAKILENSEANKYVQPLFDEIFMMVDQQRWFFESSQ